MLIAAIVLITAALVLYTLGVWTEHRAGRLTGRHVGLFLAGLLFDATGTRVMSVIAASGTAKTGPLTSVMAVTGAIALVLMALHAAWALFVVRRGNEDELRAFHRFSLGVWAVWLVPYFTGMIGSMV